jgi:uncharacterized membrane protein YphA (DoxX/SURF4 family)
MSPQELKPVDRLSVEHVGRSGIYPASGPFPPGDAVVRGQGALAHPEERPGSRPSLAVSPEQPALALGRVLFGGYFLYNGINHFLNRKSLIQYARSKQVSAAQVAVPATGALLVLGGLSLLTGTRPKVGASLITAFLLGVTPRMHPFWKIQDEGQRMQECVNFGKNVALIGGAALAAAIPEPWPGRLQVSSRALVALPARSGALVAR